MAEAVNVETKTFWKTSEFWVMLFSNLLTVATMVAEILPPKYGMVVLGVVNAAYQIARGIAKSGNPPVSIATPTVVVAPREPPLP
jgi:hypothetical protein